MSAGRRFCRSGHELTAENVYERTYELNGVQRVQRRCRECQRLATRHSRSRRSKPDSGYAPQPHLEQILDLRCGAEGQPEWIAKQMRAEADRLEAGA